MLLYGKFGSGREMLKDAINLAVEKHQGQVDKRGQPYIGHLIRVMTALPTEIVQVIGVLHDILSDTDVTATDLRQRGYPPVVIASLIALTPIHCESRENALRRAASDDLALLVKIADNDDNRDPKRMSDPPTPSELSRKSMYDRESEILKSYFQATLDGLTERLQPAQTH